MKRLIKRPSLRGAPWDWKASPRTCIHHFMTFKIATWNINSVRLRMPLIERFVQVHAPDVLCLQETKCADDAFPLKALKALGFAYIEIAGQKAYHGVATLSRLPIARAGARDFNGTGEARHLAVELTASMQSAPITIHNVYIPAGGDKPDREASPKFGNKLDYISSMTKWFADHGDKAANRYMLLGDFNVAPLETDVWSHKQLLNVVSHTPIEIEHLERLQAAHDWVDVVRRHIPADEQLYTWWSYRARDWRASNRGRRLDHLWVTPALGNASQSLEVIDEARGWEKPSDHAPVIAVIHPDAA